MKQYISVIASYTVFESIRNRLIWLVIGLLAVSIGISTFIGSLAIIEADQFQLIILAATLRFGTVFLCSLIVITGTTKDFQDKNHELVLSTSATRTHYFCGKLLGYYFIALIFSLATSLSLLIYSPTICVIFWGISLFCELIIVTTIALLLATILSQVIFSITGVVCFYLLSRSIGTIALIAQRPMADNESFSNAFIAWFIKVIAYILPNFESFTKSEWISNNFYDWSIIASILIQTIIYALLILSVALFDFNRKNI